MAITVGMREEITLSELLLAGISQDHVLINTY